MFQAANWGPPRYNASGSLAIPMIGLIALLRTAGWESSRGVTTLRFGKTTMAHATFRISRLVGTWVFCGSRPLRSALARVNRRLTLKDILTMHVIRRKVVECGVALSRLAAAIDELGDGRDPGSQTSIRDQRSSNV